MGLAGKPGTSSSFYCSHNLATGATFSSQLKRLPYHQARGQLNLQNWQEQLVRDHQLLCKLSFVNEGTFLLLRTQSCSSFHPFSPPDLSKRSFAPSSHSHLSLQLFSARLQAPPLLYFGTLGASIP